MWAGVHVETGMPAADFEELTIDQVDALNHALEERNERYRRRDAMFLAHMINANGNSKKVFTAEDFLPEKPLTKEEEGKRQRLLASYQTALEAGRAASNETADSD